MWIIFYQIYSEVRKGIKPEMYALSTLLFVTVLVLLILVNVSPKKDAETAAARKHVRRRSRAGRILIKRVIPVAICLVFVGGGIYYKPQGSMLTKEKLIVHNPEHSGSGMSSPCLKKKPACI